MINLSIGIPTTYDREEVFTKLYNKIKKQISDNMLSNKVELYYLRDDKTMTLGDKRQRLYEMAKGKFSVQIDSDDDISNDYVSTINDIIEMDETIDAVGYFEQISGFGKIQMSCFSNMWEKWDDHNIFNGKRFRYVRTPFYKMPILTEYCLKVGMNKNLRFGEDKDFSDRLKESGLIQNEYLIEKVMYYYRFKWEAHEKKYGFDK